MVTSVDPSNNTFSALLFLSTLFCYNFTEGHTCQAFKETVIFPDLNHISLVKPTFKANYARDKSGFLQPFGHSVPLLRGIQKVIVKSKYAFVMRRRPLCSAAVALLIETVCFGTSASTTCLKYTSTSKPSAGVNKRECRALGFPSLVLCLCDLTVARIAPRSASLEASSGCLHSETDVLSPVTWKKVAIKHAPLRKGMMSRGINL